MSTIPTPNGGSHTTWRHTCPKGHTSFRTRKEKDGIYCSTCLQEYPHAIDQKTGQEVSL